MANKKPGIPAIDTSDTSYSALQAMKENLELITGVRGGSPITTLSAASTQAEIITKLNEIIARLNFTGQ